ncbi:MAG: helix-turn-helix domain-containing protein [Bacteroidota bacterium]
MKHRYQNPHPQLAEYIRTVVVLEGFSEQNASELPLFTNGIPALVCRIEKDQNDGAEKIQLTLFGKTTPADCWNADEHTTIIAYFFFPFAMATFFDIPAKQLLQNPVDLASWNAHKINALKAQLIYAKSTSQKAEALDNLLIQQLQQHKKECEIIKYVTDEMMCNSDTEILSVMRDKLKLNERTFQRIFKKYVGVTPTQYRRICQFEVSFAQVRANEFNTLSDVAYDNGFADQSHFIRSFREFTQTTPNDYLRSGLKEKK